MGGGGNTRTVEYVQAPTPLQAPARSQEDIDYLQQQKLQMQEMQNSYKQNLESLNKQYEASQAQSATVLQQLQASANAQQQYAAQNRADMQLANEASSKQLTMLTASRDQAAGQAAEARSQQTQQADDMYTRLSRRRSARRTQY